MSILIFLHTLGGHYTFAQVPFEWVTDLFGFERNHFDRVAHFSVGLYAFAIVEFMCRKRLIVVRWVAYLFAIFAILSVASIYEIVEWIVTTTFSEGDSMAFLGSQGDIWDAQKDMLSDGLGALMGVAIFHIMLSYKFIQS